MSIKTHTTQDSRRKRLYILKAATTDATATALTANITTAASNNQLTLRNNSAYAFNGTIVGRESAANGTESAAFKIEGLVRREANAGTTTLVNSAITILSNADSWGGIALVADTSNGALKINVTGKSSTSIRWVATIDTSEVIYA